MYTLIVLLPFLGSRVLGRFVRPGHHALWGRQYYLLWCIDGLTRLSPLNLLTGTPMAAVYLRLLGARIGPDAHVGTAAIGLPSLVTVGALGASAWLRTTADSMASVASVRLMTRLDAPRSSGPRRRGRRASPGRRRRPATGPPRPRPAGHRGSARSSLGTTPRRRPAARRSRPGAS